MSQLSSGIVGGLSVALTFGAIQLASGRDLTGLTSSATVVTSVNRSAKSDRELVRGTQLPGRTLAVRLDSLPDTSVLIHMPAMQVHQIANEQPAGTSPSAPPPKSSATSGRKIAIACEPVVSLLTEVAKQLQPGRCLT